MKKVLIILPSDINSLETFLKEFYNARNLIENNFKLIFIFPSKSLTISKIWEFLKLLFLPKRVKNYLLLNKSLNLYDLMTKLFINIEVLSQKNVAVIHYLFINNSIGRIDLAKIVGAKNSVGLRGYDISFFPINHEGCYNYEFWNCVDSIQYNSIDLYKWALRWGAKNSTPNVKITAAVNNEYILEEELVDVRKEIDVVRLLFVGRLHWKKGLETIFRVLNKLNKSSVGYQLDIVGNGPEIEKIKFLITLLNIEQCVKLHGRISQSEIISFMDKADILLAPSLQEGCSNVVLEAQARGLYCIVSESEGMEEVVENGVTGVICERFDDDALFDAVKEYTGREYIDRLKLAKYTNRRIFTNFSREKQIREWRNYFDKLCLSL